MIRRLQLQNWRAYDNLDLEFGPGATFVVASNGIGKTSLVMGLAWGLFGEASAVNAVQEIRGDSESATVQVDLRLPSGVDIVIARSIDLKGRSTLTAELPDRSIASQNDLDALFHAEFGANSHVLAQLTVMIHGGALESFQGEFDLEEHLAGVFGVTPLLQGATVAKEIADSAASALRKVKLTQRTENRDRAKIVGDLESIEQEQRETLASRAQAVVETDGATKLIHLGQEWSRFRANVAARSEKLGALAEQGSALLEGRVNADTFVVLLQEAERSLEVSISNATDRSAVARGKAELINSAMSNLADADAICPTCLRPLSEHEAERAEEEHKKLVSELTSVIASADSEAGTLGARLEEVRQLLQQVRGLPVPLEPESQVEEAELAAADEQFQLKRLESERLDQRLAVLTTSKESLQGALLEIDEDEIRNRELENLYREEAIARASAEALRETGNSLTEQYIEPLAQEVEMRWKKIFGVGGLNLSPEGRITRQVGTRTLEFESLSGGEKVWALLLTRLLIAGASTRAPFVWLDEPLEHLDPRLRKVVAGTLAKASAGIGPRQVIVTTYEDELARQLMEDVPSASLIYVTTSR
jgi:DNA repair exonuclease SbcCD ATPase subunit